MTNGHRLDAERHPLVLQEEARLGETEKEKEKVKENEYDPALGGPSGGDSNS